MNSGRRPVRAALVAACLYIASSAQALDWTPLVFVDDPAVGLPGDPPLQSIDPLHWLDDVALVHFGATPAVALPIGSQVGAAGLWRWTSPTTIELRVAFLPDAVTG